jgi:hypothetical protein
MKLLKILPLLFVGPLLFGQATVLSADGPGNTYELINSVFAPGYDVTEAPDCAHTSFGRHIEEVWDAELNKYVFKFHIHVEPDNDRCQKFDRQRNEIKTYNQSPANLIGTYGETVVYKWKFRLDAAFQPSKNFTHIHQIKAYGGKYPDMPVVSFIARGGNPEKFQVMHSDSVASAEMAHTNLSLFKGVWVEATETITYATDGKYNVVFKKVSDNSIIFTYNNEHINMWRQQADGIRPKWGIYRSLLNPAMLRDEALLFADFSIEEIGGNLTAAIGASTLKNETLFFPNPVAESLHFTKDKWQLITVTNMEGKIVLQKKDSKTNSLDVSSLAAGTYVLLLKSATRQANARFIKK